MVADLFARLGIRVDQRSWSVADRMIHGLSRRLAAFITDFPAQQFSESLDFSDSLGRLAVMSNDAVGPISELRRAILATSDETGVMKEQIAEGVHKFTELTGEGRVAASQMDTFARVAVASSAKMSDIAQTAAAFRDNLKIQPRDFEKSFSILIAGAKEGAIELKDMSMQLAAAAPMAAQFEGGTGVEGLAKLGAAFQLIRQGVGGIRGAGQTKTRIVSMLTALTKFADRFQAHGVDPFTIDAETGEKRLRAWDDIIRDISESKLARDPQALMKAFGRVEGYQAYLQLVKVRGEWERLTKATLDADDVAEDYAKRQSQDAVKIKKAWNQVKVFFEIVFGGPMVKLIAKFAEHLDLIAIALLSVTSLMVVLRGASIAAALSSFAAWALANAPFILMAAAIMAVTIVLEDLWVAFDGGNAVLSEFAKSVKKHFATVDEIIEDAFRPFIEMMEFFGMDIRSEALLKELDAIEERMTDADWLRYGTPERFREEERRQAEEIRKRLEYENDRLERRFEAEKHEGLMRSPEYRGPAGTPPVHWMGSKFPTTGNVEHWDKTRAVQNNITINAPSGDADAIAKKTKQAVREVWDEEMRKAAAGTSR